MTHSCRCVRTCRCTCTLCTHAPQLSLHPVHKRPLHPFHYPSVGGPALQPLPILARALFTATPSSYLCLPLPCFSMHAPCVLTQEVPDLHSTACVPYTLVPAARHRPHEPTRYNASMLPLHCIPSHTCMHPSAIIHSMISRLPLMMAPPAPPRLPLIASACLQLRVPGYHCCTLLFSGLTPLPCHGDGRGRVSSADRGAISRLQTCKQRGS